MLTCFIVFMIFKAAGNFLSWLFEFNAYMICKFWKVQAFDICAWSTLLKYRKMQWSTLICFRICNTKKLESPNTTELWNAAFQFELFHTLNEFGFPFVFKLQKKVESRKKRNDLQMYLLSMKLLSWMLSSFWIIKCNHCMLPSIYCFSPRRVIGEESSDEGKLW